MSGKIIVCTLVTIYEKHRKTLIQIHLLFGIEGLP